MKHVCIRDVKMNACKKDIGKMPMLKWTLGDLLRALKRKEQLLWMRQTAKVEAEPWFEAGGRLKQNA